MEFYGSDDKKTNIVTATNITQESISFQQDPESDRWTKKACLQI